MEDSLKDTLAAWVAGHQQRIEQALERCLPAADHHPARLHEAMRYAVLGGGKRMRPLLVYAAGEAVEADPLLLDAPACAVELIHAYSLVHDDLPAMDNDDLRRGKPTCHKAYGEAMAILAGDALQAQAFLLLAKPIPGLPAEQRAAMIQALAEASGWEGMVGGQVIDLEAVGRRLEPKALEEMHGRKTGALIRASCILGAMAQVPVDTDALEALAGFAARIGLAFQIRDDILDVEGDTASIGKPQGSDAARDKPTYPAIIGMDASKRMAAALYEEALDRVSLFGERARSLRSLAAFIVQRSR